MWQMLHMPDVVALTTDWEHCVQVWAPAGSANLADHCKWCHCTPIFSSTCALGRYKDEKYRLILEAFFIQTQTINVSAQLLSHCQWKNAISYIKTCLTCTFDKWLQACSTIYGQASVGAWSMNVSVYPHLFTYYNQLKTSVLHVLASLLFS